MTKILALFAVGLTTFSQARAEEKGVLLRFNPERRACRISVASLTSPNHFSALMTEFGALLFGKGTEKEFSQTRPNLAKATAERVNSGEISDTDPWNPYWSIQSIIEESKLEAGRKTDAAVWHSLRLNLETIAHIESRAEGPLSNEKSQTIYAAVQMILNEAKATPIPVDFNPSNNLDARHDIFRALRDALISISAYAARLPEPPVSFIVMQGPEKKLPWATELFDTFLELNHKN